MLFRQPLIFGLMFVPAMLNVAQADIYIFKDDEGIQHLTNVRQGNAQRVMRTPSFVNSDQPENVQNLLNQPRFTKKVTTSANTRAFRGKYPKPIGITLSGFGSVNMPPLPKTARKNIPFRVNQENQRLYAPYIRVIAAKYRLDPALIHAVIAAESAFNPKARSPVGAQGLMQLMPPTAKRFGVENAYDPIQNIQGGAAYLRFLLDRFNDISLAVAGYNAGEGAVGKYNNTIPPYAETQAYVPRVLAFYEKYRREFLENPY